MTVPARGWQETKGQDVAQYEVVMTMTYVVEVEADNEHEAFEAALDVDTANERPANIDMIEANLMEDDDA